MRTLFYVRSGYQIAGYHQAHDGGGDMFNPHQVGMGHIVRCALLAEALDDAIILTHTQEPGWEYMKTRGVPLVGLEYENDEAASLKSALSRTGASRLIVDHMETNNNLLDEIRGTVEQLIVLVGIGWSITERTRMLADYIVFQGIGVPSRQVQEAPGGRILTSPRHLILGPAKPSTKRDGVLVFMGGAIPWSYSVDVCKGLDGLGLHGTVVAGWHLNGYANDLPASFQIAIRPMSLASLQATHEIQVCSMGMSVYEAMLGDIPVVCVSRDADHWASADELDARGLLVDCGLAHHTKPSEIAEWAASLPPDDIKGMTGAAKHEVDGLGIQRIIEAIE